MRGRPGCRSNAICTSVREAPECLCARCAAGRADHRMISRGASQDASFKVSGDPAGSRRMPAGSYSRAWLHGLVAGEDCHRHAVMVVRPFELRSTCSARSTGKPSALRLWMNAAMHERVHAVPGHILEMRKHLVRSRRRRLVRLACRSAQSFRWRQASSWPPVRSAASVAPAACRSLRRWLRRAATLPASGPRAERVEADGGPVVAAPSMLASLLHAP